MGTQSPFLPSQHGTLRLSEIRQPGEHALQLCSREVPFTVVKVLEPFTKSAVVLARCEAISTSSPVILKIYDPRYHDARNLRYMNRRIPRPWTLEAEAEAAASTEPLRWGDYPLIIPDELREDEPVSEDPQGVVHRKGRWELFYQHLSRESYHTELAAYKKLADLQGTALPRLLAVGYHVPSDERLYEPPVLVFEYIVGPTIESAPATALTPKLVAQLYQDIQLIGPRGVMHNDLRPANIILSSSRERAVIIDFGLGCVRRDESDEEWARAVASCNEKVVVAIMLKRKLIPWKPEFQIPSYVVNDNGIRRRPEDSHE